MNQGTNSIVVHKLTKTFGGVAALNGVDFSFQKGLITSIVGPNGSGKTTLVNALSGIFPFDSGTITVEGVSARKIRPWAIARTGLTRTFQEVRLFEQMSAYENILIALTNRHPVFSLFEFFSPAAHARVQEILKQVGMQEKSNSFAGELSYGQRKLLEIGRALASQPRIIFFDEPFAGLFPGMIRQVVDLLKQLRKKGITQILIEHNMELVRELSDYVIVMDAGQVLAHGKPDDVLSRREVMEAYLGE